jgi:hypothetical protein
MRPACLAPGETMTGADEIRLPLSRHFRPWSKPVEDLSQLLTPLPFPSSLDRVGPEITQTVVLRRGVAATVDVDEPLAKGAEGEGGSTPRCSTTRPAPHRDPRRVRQARRDVRPGRRAPGQGARRGAGVASVPDWGRWADTLSREYWLSAPTTAESACDAVRSAVRSTSSGRSAPPQFQQPLADVVIRRGRRRRYSAGVAAPAVRSDEQPRP